MKKVVRSVLLALAASAMLGGTCWAEVPTPTMGVEISYPILDLQNDKVQEKINLDIFKRANRANTAVGRQIQAGDIISTVLATKVSYQDENFLSLRTYEYFYLQFAAHPISWEYGQIYRLSDGKSLSLEELAKEPEFSQHADRYTLRSVIRAIERDYGNLLYSRVVKLEEIPKDIYLDENKHIHVIVQTYVLAPYAIGTIDVDLDKE